MQFRCDIQAWHACPEHVSELTGHPLPPTQSKVPAGIKRRASQLSKLVINTCLPIIAERSVDYVVFATQHGEIHRTLNLLTDLASEEELSPTAFAQSVTSTAPGLLTIASKQPIAFTTVSGGKNTLQAGLIEVAMRFYQQPQSNILLIVTDEALPEIYQHHSAEQHQQNLLALYFTQGQSWQIECNSANNGEHSAGEAEPAETSARTRFADKLADNTSFDFDFTNTRWSWKKL
ncbi:hypothetical protein EXU30_04115 [Shewanella maritima]|uniref:Beta-ketoacyl synthase-like N-terminal domain-containing protein n=1 Tax=Shewanella maritima TaxID=2520507 RepID=A0A411PEL5_9GAMM|nr:beta-ketoacyl synthase chain length factor [Shewanella maritima]QBF81973.1 hypothetical protein EXU30_04115 [Shewanella maritima]